MANSSWQDIRRRRVRTDRDEQDVAAERRLLGFEVALNECGRLEITAVFDDASVPLTGA
jgi:hypothetical protein